MRIEHNKIIFSTGHEVSIFGEALSITPPEFNDNEWYAGYGEDGELVLNTNYDDPDLLTSEEQREMADYMIALWQRFKASVT